MDLTGELMILGLQVLVTPILAQVTPRIGALGTPGPKGMAGRKMALGSAIHSISHLSHVKLRVSNCVVCSNPYYYVEITLCARA